jgi:hypothetical protein
LAPTLKSRAAADYKLAATSNQGLMLMPFD